jgi:4-amino-4-deoxy-L-arabinose transferase-like glycosyltransferase
VLDRLDSHTIPFAWIAFILLFASFITFFWSKKWGIRLLMISSGFLGYFMATLDPFLNLWDEQQHALVAKNMAESPFKPMLYKTAFLEYDSHSWINNHIWIHKQPLFLWQMAIFVKILGAKVIAIRLPSIILHAILPYLVYRIGKIVRNELSGFIAAIFIAFANFPLEMVAGRYATDHNDVSFLFYVTWSVLCWLEYQNTKDKKWLILLGLSAGCAVLVKWLMGLIVYICWFLVITIQNKFKIWQLRNYLVMVKPFIISLLIFLPWQIYCFVRFPKEAAYEMKVSASHFSTEVEGHGGDWNYHLDQGFHALYFNQTYLMADWMPHLVLLLVGVGIWKMKNKVYQLFVGIMIAFVYLFFSLAATKMLGFTLIAMPLVFIGIAVSLDWLRELWSKFIKIPVLSYAILGALLISPTWQLFKLDNLTKKHSLEFPEFNDNRQRELDEFAFCNFLQTKYGDQKIAIFNANITVVGYIPIMFSTDFLAYGYKPDDQQMVKILNEGYKLVLLDRNDLEKEYLLDKRIEILNVEEIISDFH